MHPLATTPQFLQLHQTDAAAVRAELAAGLRAQPPQVSPKFLYDPLGSRLFDAITELVEYYPTRTEAAIFREQATAMAQCVPAGTVLVDLGAGSCAKASGLFPVLRPAAYVAVDISVDYLRGTMAQLQQRHPALPMLGLGMDFSTQLALPLPAADWLEQQDLTAAPRCVFYPGSSIGNFNAAEALALLQQAHALCAAGGPGGGILIGVDRVKAPTILEPAYDDPLGVTAAFNRNVLLNTNALLGTDFAPARWQHVAFFNQADARIEMHLQSLGAQTVRWPGGERAFADGERLHTENSYKWQPAAFDALLREAGFGPSTHWTDPQDWFSVFWAPAS
jgi:dimethylhistidine N-methyltransferase